MLLNESLNMKISGYTNPTVVALASDSSAYTDESGNYILADSITGDSLLLDTETYTTTIVEGNFYGMAGADAVYPFKNINLGGEICYVTANGTDVKTLIIKRDGTRLFKSYKKDGGNFDISGDVFRIVSSVSIGTSYYFTAYSLIEGTVYKYYNESETCTVTKNQVLSNKATGVVVYSEQQL